MNSKASLPTIDDVPDLRHNPDLPPFFRSLPQGPGGLVMLDGVESVRVFALSYDWETADQQQSAYGWAMHEPVGYATAATIRQFPDLSHAVMDSIGYSCNVACIGALAREGVSSIAYVVLPGQGGQVTHPVPILTPRGFPAGAYRANFDTAAPPYSGKTTDELLLAKGKEAAFNRLISDVRAGAYLL